MATHTYAKSKVFKFYEFAKNGVPLCVFFGINYYWLNQNEMGLWQRS